MPESGRIFIRPSGTEPFLRILVEAKDAALVEEVSEYLLSRLRESFVCP
jgi:phosphoglucosamine mutase